MTDSGALNGKDKTEVVDASAVKRPGGPSREDRAYPDDPGLFGSQSLHRIDL
jgi:hypothetical protein